MKHYKKLLILRWLINYLEMIIKKQSCCETDELLSRHLTGRTKENHASFGVKIGDFSAEPSELKSRTLPLSQPARSHPLPLCASLSADLRWILEITIKKSL
jgi:hypothetical protein